MTAGLLVGILVAALDQTIVDTAFPRMISELGGVAIFTWVITVYLLASTAIVPVVGKLADIFGRRVFYLTGLSLFVVGSALCGAAQSMLQLIAFRALQGLGAGMLMPITFTIVGDVFPGAARARMQGLFSSAWGVAAVVGPKLGGWITHHYSWRWVFYVNLPVGILAAALMLAAYRESRGARRPVDWLGSAAVTAGVVLLLIALAQGGEAWPWDSATSIALFLGSGALFAAFLAAERRAAEPVLDLRLFGDRTFAVMSATAFLMGAGMFGCIIFVPWFIQGVVGVDPNVAGNVMTPVMLSMVVCSFLSGRLALRLPYRYQLTAGFALVGAGFYLMTGWTAQTTKLQATLHTMVAGSGLGLIMPLLVLAVQNAFPAHRRGVVTSAITFFRSIGATAGATAFGALFNHEMVRHFRGGLAQRLAVAGPMLAGMPAPQEGIRHLAEKPQSLVQLLLRGEMQAMLPEAMREPVLAAIKDMMAASLQVVFAAGMGVVLAGALLVQWLGNTSLKAQIAAVGTPAAADGAPAAAMEPASHD